jgi:hypothetical protein
MANINWRTINIDALDPDSPANFDLSSLTPTVVPVSTADVQENAQQIRQLLRGGDNEGALQAALEQPPYGADDKGKVRRGTQHHARLPVHGSGTLLPNVSLLQAAVATVTLVLGSRRPGRRTQLHTRERLTGFTALGTPSRGRHRDPPVNTAVGHVTNTQPHIHGQRWYRGLGCADEIHVRLDLLEALRCCIRLSR